MNEKFSKLYPVKEKLFGKRAERITREEYQSIIKELQSDLENHFYKLRAPEQLIDKESFGDIDLVCFPKRTIDELYFRKIFAERLLAYHRGGHIHSLLVKLIFGKQI